MDQEIRFCTSTDGIRLAYARVGARPPIVRAGTFLTHLEYDWLSPVWRPWLDNFSRFHTLYRYDARHPDRVSHLIIYGGYLFGAKYNDLTSLDREEAEVRKKYSNWPGPPVILPTARCLRPPRYRKARPNKSNG